MGIPPISRFENGTNNWELLLLEKTGNPRGDLSNGLTYFKKKMQAVMSYREGYTHSQGDLNPVVYIEKAILIYGCCYSLTFISHCHNKLQACCISNNAHCSFKPTMLIALSNQQSKHM
ncbi:putative ribosomal protein S11 [Forsythia ovata]